MKFKALAVLVIGAIAAMSCDHSRSAFGPATLGTQVTAGLDQLLVAGRTYDLLPLDFYGGTNGFSLPKIPVSIIGENQEGGFGQVESLQLVKDGNVIGQATPSGELTSIPLQTPLRVRPGATENLNIRVVLKKLETAQTGRQFVLAVFADKLEAKSLVGQQVVTVSGGAMSGRKTVLESVVKLAYSAQQPNQLACDPLIYQPLMNFEVSSETEKYITIPGTSFVDQGRTAVSKLSFRIRGLEIGQYHVRLNYQDGQILSWFVSDNGDGSFAFEFYSFPFGIAPYLPVMQDRPRELQLQVRLLECPAPDSKITVEIEPDGDEFHLDSLWALESVGSGSKWLFSDLNITSDPITNNPLTKPQWYGLYDAIVVEGAPAVYQN